MIIRPYQNPPERSLLTLVIVCNHLCFCPSQHFPHYLNILVFTGLYIIMQLQQPSTVFASFDSSGNGEPDFPDGEDHLVPKLHEFFLDLNFPPTPLPLSADESERNRL